VGVWPNIKQAGRGPASTTRLASGTRRQIASQFADFWRAWWHGAVLIYQPRLFGILPMYAVFMLLLPLLLQQMAKGRAVLIWAASITLWLAAQLGGGKLCEQSAVAATCIL
jgi:hypothetical protein